MSERRQLYALAIAATGMAFTACGGAAPTKRITATARAETTNDAQRARMGQLDACLQRQGMTGIAHSSSATTVGGVRLPGGMTLARYDGALRRCRDVVDLGSTFHKREASSAIQGFSPRVPK